MPRKAVMDAVKARLGTVWSGLPVAYPNDGTVDAPAAGTAFLRVDFPLAREQQITVGAPGANIWREEGVFRIVINAASNASLDGPLMWAEQLAALFRGKSFADVQTFATSSAELDDDSESGNYYLLSVVVEYQHDLIG